jgi:hypothetical protein
MLLQQKYELKEKSKLNVVLIKYELKEKSKLYVVSTKI